MTDTQCLILFIATALGGLAIVGPRDHDDAVRIDQMRAEYQARQPVLVRHELRGCAPTLLRRDDGRIVQECAQWAVYDDGREVLARLVKVPVPAVPRAGISTAAPATAREAAAGEQP